MFEAETWADIIAALGRRARLDEQRDEPRGHPECDSVPRDWRAEYAGQRVAAEGGCTRRESDQDQGQGRQRTCVSHGGANGAATVVLAACYLLLARA